MGTQLTTNTPEPRNPDAFKAISHLFDRGWLHKSRRYQMEGNRAGGGPVSKLRRFYDDGSIGKLAATHLRLIHRFRA